MKFSTMSYYFESAVLEQGNVKNPQDCGPRGPKLGTLVLGQKSMLLMCGYNVVILLYSVFIY